MNAMMEAEEMEQESAAKAMYLAMIEEEKGREQEEGCHAIAQRF